MLAVTVKFYIAMSQKQFLNASPHHATDKHLHKLLHFVNDPFADGASLQHAWSIVEAFEDFIS
ncbi:MAG: hypothetical protein AB8B73_00085 [Ekhidna sp.]